MEATAEQKAAVEKVLAMARELCERHKDEDATGTAECPECGGVVRYHVADKGKFLVCNCDTPDCFYLIT